MDKRDMTTAESLFWAAFCPLLQARFNARFPLDWEKFIQAENEAYPLAMEIVGRFLEENYATVAEARELADRIYRKVNTRPPTGQPKIIPFPSQGTKET